MNEVATHCPSAGVCAGASVHSVSWYRVAGGECGNPSIQTCSQRPPTVSTDPYVPVQELFANYAGDYTDALGQTHVLCTGSDECCEGGVWGDVIPSGKWLRRHYARPT